MDLDTQLSDEGERILFINDEARLTELGKAMLQEWGYSVTTCLSGAEAMKLITLAKCRFIW